MRGRCWRRAARARDSDCHGAHETTGLSLTQLKSESAGHNPNGPFRGPPPKGPVRGMPACGIRGDSLLRRPPRVRRDRPAAGSVEERQVMLKRVSFFVYGAVCYLVFFATFLYAIGFIGNFAVPTTLDGPATDSLGLSLAINLGLLSLF